jgi:hypothetical protein
MYSSQIPWLIILIPLFLIYGFVELNRGWKILKYGQDSLDVVIRIRIWLIRLIKGEKSAKIIKGV